MAKKIKKIVSVGDKDYTLDLNEVLPTPVSTAAEENANTSESSSSLCLTCIHKAVCFKRRTVVNAVMAAKNSFGVGEIKPYPRFDFTVSVNECDEYDNGK